MARRRAFMRFFALAVVLTPVVVLNVRIGVQRSVSALTSKRRKRPSLAAVEIRLPFESVEASELRSPCADSPGSNPRHRDVSRTWSSPHGRAQRSGAPGSG